MILIQFIQIRKYFRNILKRYLEKNLSEIEFLSNFYKLKK